MPALKNKVVLILSPQSWGKMRVSKHHYGVELAKRGNTVFFLNPPEQTKIQRRESITIIPSGAHDNLFLVEHSLFFPYELKFHALPLFHWLMKFHVKRLLKEIGKSIDVVWSFDIGNLYPLRFFGRKPFKIYHPVDEPAPGPGIAAAKDAAVIFSVTQEILDKFKHLNVPRYFVNHGLSGEFSSTFGSTGAKNNPIRIGFSGNLLRPEIDREALIEIVRGNRNCVFEFWGSHSAEQTNIGGTEDEPTKKFIDALRSHSNVILNGVVSSSDLARAIKNMDAFLICYDVGRDQSHGTNYHKIIEYLSTGKAIISNNVTTYKNQPDLVYMVNERDHNRYLPELFSKIIGDLPFYNNESLQEQRIRFAHANTYEIQIARIEEIINR